MKCVCEEDLWNTVWVWWMHSAASLQLNRDCWHRGSRLQAYLSNCDLIHACTESHLDIYNSHSPSPLSLCHAGSIARATVCYLCRWKINHNSFISKESRFLLQTIGRLRLCPASEGKHVNTEDSLMFNILGLWMSLLFRKLKWCFCRLMILWNIVKKICLSDGLERGR